MCQVVAILELTGIWVTVAFPTLKLLFAVSPSTTLKVMVAVNFWGASLNRLPFGWFWEVFEFHPGNIVYRDTSSTETVQTFFPSQFFHLRFFPLLEFDLGALAKRSVSPAFAEVLIGDAHVVRSSIQHENRVYLCTQCFCQMA